MDLAASGLLATRRPLALDKIADDAGEDILKAMVEAAKSGDIRRLTGAAEDLACPEVTADRLCRCP